MDHDDAVEGHREENDGRLVPVAIVGDVVRDVRLRLGVVEVVQHDRGGWEQSRKQQPDVEEQSSLLESQWEREVNWVDWVKLFENMKEKTDG